MANIVWFNLKDYAPFELILFGVGALSWIVSYIFIVRSIIKHKFVEMPAGVLCANIAWEFMWSWVFEIDMGFALRLGYMAWFFIDIFFVYSFYKYGHKQVSKVMVPYHKLIFTFGLVGWFVAQYLFVKQGFDNPIGANSAYVINILISLLYILMFIRLDEQYKSLMSFTAGWTKGLGTGLISVMCLLKWPDNYWLLSMCTACLVMDIYYVYIFLQYKKQSKGERNTIKTTEEVLA